MFEQYKHLSRPWRLAGALLGALLCVMPAQAAEKFKVVTTFTIIADTARNVAGAAAVQAVVTRASRSGGAERVAR
ncbi:hypothetical protein [Pseudomonas monteilii]|uniref:hypothetical protein n=1 Tax=Pseudomonas monteilii TaxID=76759 RepID=UPI001C71722C|nr:hypothetical protein [Pseudomonas monteilii]